MSSTCTSRLLGSMATWPERVVRVARRRSSINSQSWLVRFCAETNYSFEIQLTKPEIASNSPSDGSSLSDYLRPRCQEVCGLQPDRGMVTRWQKKVREKRGLRMRNPGKAGIRVPR